MAGKSIKQRPRAIDVNNLTPQQIVQLSGSIAKVTKEIVDDAKKKIQDMLDVYGMKVTIQYNITPKEELLKTEEAQPEEPKAE